MQLDSKLRFDNFVVGSANRLAVAAARAVAEAPGAVYNPLFIYSGSGLGKTHLMSAIGNQVAQRAADARRRARSRSTTSSSELHAAIAAGDDRTRSSSATCSVGVLLIDDMQFLTGHRETQTRAAAHLQRAAGRRTADRHDERPSAGRDRRRRRAADHAAVRRTDRRHRRAGLRDAHGDPQGQVRGARRALPRRRDRGGRPARVRERARAAGRAQSPDRLSRRSAASRSTPSTVRGRCSATSPSSAPRVDAAAARAASSQSFLTDIASAVAQHVEQWKTRLTEAIEYWSGEGYRTGALERAAAGQRAADERRVVAPRVRGDASTQLRDLERQIVRARSRRSAAHDAFRDPDRVDEAEQLLERALRTSAPPPGPSAAFTRAGFEVGAQQSARGARRGRDRRRAGRALQPAVHPRPERRRARRTC